MDSNPTTTTPVASKYKVLIVEDDVVLLKMYEKRLLADGYQILTAADGQEALDIFNKEKLDLILTDIMMPKVSGIELIEKVRTAKKGKTIPIIAWSNLSFEEEKQQALSLGVNEYLVKGTLTLEQVSETVKKYLK
ncbi:hypothetical protein A2962_04870 [Candidatus Woesebacteria bacterium RIFCSPLOWO2_01_FULL_39_61]|uniref:Response regulatory domain-containing protein n=1 Tax=Candidatus Woesebacteria bacterium RIFCSPHIGHO2_02_FULL_39_13 TaxID=1802505 RepID=A0A1F7Z5Q0_9BACT|nr:MAG: hypothetical protein A2692_00835 [Candidatus Woesebacteria bacterium RIFCSPHIGHO2_01_FULL_39_95]OGM34248.1 MAG: hypothetical protein A3D01_01860 [Candidatus Woesebacteria bacterium RIFCSPHIGHO2_02_FULL_39_13]OGM38593.1 MAG: hypothetical protein A3E13_00380 [Candidatus Woesebacteria bacterium RIFCSPHIGHO2_12_FULL_40_20]OGM67078.1 MAG: hypothetical protein A2962_04870 [Candidatus Woesebacteria bacterium RIFCSPLOWO2_01_FULL_39_61]